MGAEGGAPLRLLAAGTGAHSGSGGSGGGGDLGGSLADAGEYAALVRAAELALGCARASLVLALVSCGLAVLPCRQSLQTVAALLCLGAAGIAALGLAVGGGMCLQHVRCLVVEALHAWTGGAVALWPSQTGLAPAWGGIACACGCCLGLLAALLSLGCRGGGGDCHPDDPGSTKIAEVGEDAADVRAREALLHEALRARRLLLDEHTRWVDGLAVGSLGAFVALLFLALRIVGARAVRLGVQNALHGQVPLHGFGPPGGDGGAWPGWRVGEMPRQEAVRDLRAAAIRRSIRAAMGVNTFRNRLRQGLNGTSGAQTGAAMWLARAPKLAARRARAQQSMWTRRRRRSQR